jgi:hypothetical protein
LALLILEAIESVLQPRDGAKRRDRNRQIYLVFGTGALEQRLDPS